MRSWHHHHHHHRDDDESSSRLCNSAAFALHPTVRRTYCERHRHQPQLDDKSREENQRYYEFNEDESLVNSLESSASDCRFERRRQLHESPTTSCLKTVTDAKKNKSKKRVNFAEEEASASRYTYASSSSSRNNNPTVAIARRRDYVNQPASQSTMADIVQSSTSALEDLSLSSSCAANNSPPPPPPPPRIVKPRDVLRRPAARKLMIYPPEGQRGDPLTLNKKWSKIQCRVDGDEATGFRYKVYYLQTFESDKWFPNSKTNSPFYHDDYHDNSTDYGN